MSRSASRDEIFNVSGYEKQLMQPTLHAEGHAIKPQSREQSPKLKQKERKDTARTRATTSVRNKMVDTTPVIAATAISRKTSQQRAAPVSLSVPLEIRLKVLRRVTEMSTVQDLEIILIKLWRIVK